LGGALRRDGRQGDGRLHEGRLKLCGFSNSLRPEFVERDLLAAVDLVKHLTS
jgi:hypothetical protein